MKKWLFAAGLGIAMAASASVQAAESIAVVNMGNLFQQRLQRDGSTMKASERSKLEKDVMAQRQTFSTKAQAFEQDRQRRSGEERGKLVTRIQSAVKKVADDKGYDVVLDTNTVAYAGSSVKDITADVLKQVK